ncbi:macro domain-containing protein [Gilliamella sp. Pas-s95]|uniref:type II toxin-antitoxin system antitoxin DNA ADP-ribosyl glycohydrolase DarG n=1 Tax=Gilliamella sp. Pas-s95 TaxID=2687317 RepID=UPI00132143C9|nr:macro domain-containing protein [Gilliamella sp. Pas-s95]MWN05358.1 Appr-1-p processing protein [Gilliamella sp. Pas-s95]
MIRYTKGNLLEANVEALVNTVNTVGVMGKGIALMFKERFPKNMFEYARACNLNQVTTGKMFVTETGELIGPRWIVNFPTKQHWRSLSQIEWIEDGLVDLRHFIVTNHVKSIAIPPLGAGNGGLDWAQVKLRIEHVLGDLNSVDIIVYEPTQQYQNVAKRQGVKKLTPARALVAELIRRYWILGMECSLLEIQKLTWFLKRVIDKQGLKNDFNLQFQAHNYGPYACNLNYLLNSLDGSYLKSDKRIPDCKAFDVIWFNNDEQLTVSTYLNSEGKHYLSALDETTRLIDGFESPFGMELLATVDWVISQTQCKPTLCDVKEQIAHWPAGERWAQRKLRLFSDKHINYALERLQGFAY